MMAQGMDERVGSKDQDVQGKIFLGPKALMRGGSSLFSGTTPFWVSPCIPHTCLPLEPTYVSPTLLPNSTGVLVDPMPVTGGRLEGPGEGQGPLIPAHLLVQIVVKQDRSGRSTAPGSAGPSAGRPAGCCCPEGRGQEGGWGGKDGAALAPQPHPKQVYSISPEPEALTSLRLGPSLQESGKAHVTVLQGPQSLPLRREGKLRLREMKGLGQRHRAGSPNQCPNPSPARWVGAVSGHVSRGSFSRLQLSGSAGSAPASEGKGDGDRPERKAGPLDEVEFRLWESRIEVSERLPL